jgi:ketosteroid isomerase-like protein
MTTTDSHATGAAEIRARLHAWAGALRRPSMVSQRAQDVLSFDCHSRLQFRGADALRRHLQACLPCMQGPMLFEIHDLAVTVQGDLAFGHFLARCGATGSDGEEHVSWLRATACLRKTGGEWASCTSISPRPSIRTAARRCSISSRTMYSGRVPRKPARAGLRRNATIARISGASQRGSESFRRRPDTRSVVRRGDEAGSPAEGWRPDAWWARRFDRPQQNGGE